MTAKKIALRMLWDAGHYLERQQYQAMGVFERLNPQVRALAEATRLVAHAYNAVLGESHVPRPQ